MNTIRSCAFRRSTQQALAFITFFALTGFLSACANPTPAPIPATLPTNMLAPTSVPQPAETPKPTSAPSSSLTKISADGATMVLVPAGDFIMGSDNPDILAYDSGKPAHMVYLDAFWMDTFEVTIALYKKCVDAGKCTEPTNKSLSTSSLYFGNTQFDNYPVSYMKWDQAKAYCEWADKRLPTEAEWEKAARGTDGRLFPWGNNFDGTQLNFCDKNCESSWKDTDWDDGFADTSPVGNYARGASPYGIMDLAGNVLEWVSDWYADKYYASSPRNNPTGPSSGQAHVVRGGSWQHAQGDTRLVIRSWKASSAYINVGFRCAKSQ